jgi:hypothetical protein
LETKWRRDGQPETIVSTYQSEGGEVTHKTKGATPHPPPRQDPPLPEEKPSLAVDFGFDQDLDMSQVSLWFVQTPPPGPQGHTQR